MLHPSRSLITQGKERAKKNATIIKIERYICTSPRLFSSDVRDDDAKDPDVRQKERDAAQPEARHESALSEELELIALLEPYCLFFGDC